MTDPRPMFSEADFRKSSYSEPDKDCVHVARRDGWAEVRDSKTTFGAANDHHLVLAGLEATAFLSAIKTGRLDH